MKLLKSLCLASALAGLVDKKQREKRGCLISELAKPKHFDQWKCYDKNGDKTISATRVPLRSKCFLNCKSGYYEYKLNGAKYHKCTERNGWSAPKRKNNICARDIETTIQRIEQRLETVESTNIFHPFEKIVQVYVKEGYFGDENFVLDISDAVPYHASFILADVWINDAVNQYWSVTFSKDRNIQCQGWSFDGRAPLDVYDGRTQTVTVAYDADQAANSTAYPRFGQWLPSVMVPLALSEVNVCIDDKDVSNELASVFLFVHGYYGVNIEAFVTKLRGKCFQNENIGGQTETPFIYTVCPYGQVTQFDQRYNATYYLGSWDGTDVTESNSVMNFVDGAGPCSNGVYRSTEINFFCGTSTGIISVDEFSHCKYTVKFSFECK